jgi:hypothetical protein
MPRLPKGFARRCEPPESRSGSYKRELRGGEAWDRQIRKQIHDCALFVPVISAHSDARREGYFRREWKLAAERTADMAESRSKPPRSLTLSQEPRFQAVERELKLPN